MPDNTHPSILAQHSAVTYETAARLLEVGARHLRRLVELGELERVGRGHFKRITSTSIKRYRGTEKEIRL